MRGGRRPGWAAPLSRPPGCRVGPRLRRSRRGGKRGRRRRRRRGRRWTGSSTISRGMTAARLARDVVAALPPGALLVLGSSTPVRDVDRLAVPRGDVTVLANRGVSGIDGTVSTAVGAALVHQRAGRGPAVALLGDLTLLHDLTGLLVGDGEAVPDLTIVVPDNDGGGIFAQLEPGEERHARDYRRVFGTPHGRDLVAVAESLGWPASAVDSPGALRETLARGGPRVVVVRTHQRAEAELARALRDAAVRALS